MQKISELEQLKAFIKLVKAWGLDDEFRAHDWVGIAAAYNGRKYKENNYDVRLADAYSYFKRHSRTGRAQLALESDLDDEGGETIAAAESPSGGDPQAPTDPNQAPPRDP